nr:hypothetical protein [Salmonid herpesvirus 1]
MAKLFDITKGGEPLDSTPLMTLGEFRIWPSDKCPRNINCVRYNCSIWDYLPGMVFRSISEEAGSAMYQHCVQFFDDFELKLFNEEDRDNLDNGTCAQFDRLLWDILDQCMQLSPVYWDTFWIKDAQVPWIERALELGLKLDRVLRNQGPMIGYLHPNLGMRIYSKSLVASQSVTVIRIRGERVYHTPKKISEMEAFVGFTGYCHVLCPNMDPLTRI